MKARLSAIAGAVKAALLSKEARGPELALARIVLAAVAAKCGVDAGVVIARLLGA